MQAETIKDKAYQLRPYTEDDIPLIQSSWGSSYYKGANYHHYLSPQEFHRFHRPIREAYFKRPTAAVIVATAKDDPTQILGWIALEKVNQALVVHYIYVKQIYKNLKIASDLLETTTAKHQSVLFTHLTEKAARIMDKHSYRYNHLFFAPHLV